MCKSAIPMLYVCGWVMCGCDVGCVHIGGFTHNICDKGHGWIYHARSSV